jgi:hypothetical protein
VVTTTGPQPVRGVGNTIRRAFRTALTIDYGNAQAELNVHWHRRAGGQAM